MTKIKNKLSVATALLGGVLSHHYGSKLLDYRDTMAASQEQALKDQAAEQDIISIKNKLTELSNETKDLSEKLSQVVENKNISELKLKEAHDKLEQSADMCNVAKEILDKGSEQMNPGYYSKAYNAIMRCHEGQSDAFSAVKSLYDDINKNKFIPGLDDLNNYLNSLSLLELSALFNSVILFLICILITNIIITLTSNELINYLKLEDRFPKLSKFLKLRLKFQKYYVILHFIFIIFVAIGAIGLNSLVFI
jgi:hypothetical protein